MKRLNPETGLPFKMGETRDDGYIFRTYQKQIVKSDGFFKESWLSPSATERFTEKVKVACSEWVDRRVIKRREYLDAIKLKSGCVDCGYNKSSVALDFDHVTGPPKKFTIGTKYIFVTQKDLDEEISKCVVRCANCHRIVTQERRKEKEVTTNG